MNVSSENRAMPFERPEYGFDQDGRIVYIGTMCVIVYNANDLTSQLRSMRQVQAIPEITIK